MFACRTSLLTYGRSQIRPRTSFRARQSILSQLLSTLAILEQREGQLNKTSLSAVTAAHRLCGSVTGFIAGSNVKSIAEEAAKVQGVEKIIVVENGSYDKVTAPCCLREPGN